MNVARLNNWRRLFLIPPAALARLHAWCWQEQAERVYARDDLTVDVSVHFFSGTEGAALSARWFAFQRAEEHGLKVDGKTRENLPDLNGVDLSALDNIWIDALYNDNEYTVYASPSLYVVRVTVSGEPSAGGRSRDVVAYMVLSLVLRLNLFGWPYSVP